MYSQEEIKAAIATPKEERTQRQKEIIFGDCNPNRQYEAYKNRAAELVRRLDAGEYLSKADKKEARFIKKTERFNWEKS